MKNLVIWTSSCGHVTFREVSDDEWKEWATPREVQPPIGKPQLFTPFTRTGRKTRAVYMWPLRFMLCSDCAFDASDWR